MDWKLLKHDEFTSIAASIDYNGGKIKTGELYQKLRQSQHPLESKVKFILQHWGWDGTPRKEAVPILSAINDFGFSIPQNVKTFYEQLYGLTLPSKKIIKENGKVVRTTCGGALRLELSVGDGHDLEIYELESGLIGSEYLGVRFDDDILPIGYRLIFFADEQLLPEGWEDPDHRCRTRGAWGHDLFLGSSGKVYLWDRELSDYLAVAGESLISFFASAFGLIYDTEKSCGYSTENNGYELREQIEELMHQGKYTQHYFKNKSPY